jgi:hypothetical protein
MYEVGAKYELRMIEGGDEMLFWGVVEAYEHPLIKLADTPAIRTETIDNKDDHSIAFVEDPDGEPIRGAIINVTSPNFISALKQSA